MGVTRELLKVKHGLTTRQTRRTVAVTTSATQIMPHHADRLSFIVMNLSANFGFAVDSVEVSSSLGIRQNGNGGRLGANWEDDGEIVTSSWFGVNDTSTGNWLVLETFGVPDAD